MQALQPIQIDLSKSTMPSARLNMAVVGQAVTQGACALIAARYLVRAARLGRDADVDVLYIGARDADRNNVFRLAGSGAGMTTDATSVVDDLGPLNLLRLKHGFD